MRRGSVMKKTVLLVAAAGLLILWLGAVAQAASPQDLYDDFVQHGVDLTGTYSVEELAAYLTDSAVHEQVGKDPAIARKLDSLVSLVMGRMREGASFSDALFEYSGHAFETEPQTFPRTGHEYRLTLLGGLSLMGGGFVLRRRPHPGAIGRAPR
ncbi:MAG: hypothetical protein ACYC5Q_12965 [Thermoleophilia bacterium]